MCAFLKYILVIYIAFSHKEYLHVFKIKPPTKNSQLMGGVLRFNLLALNNASALQREVYIKEKDYVKFIFSQNSLLVLYIHSISSNIQFWEI